MRNKFLVGILMVGIMVLTACSQAANQVTPSVFEGLELKPYHTATLTPTLTPTPQNAPTATLAPTVTPTPQEYIVRANDTMVVIAFRNGLTLEELQAANPDVDPYTLSIGTKLLIPAAKPGTGTQTASAPTPLPLQVLSTSCTPSLTGGYYCFGEVRNDQGFPLENLTAEFRLTNAINGDVVTMNALLPLTILNADMSIPFFAYFSPPIFDNPQVELQVQTATSANLENPGIFALKVDQPEISLSADAQWAAVSGGVQLQEPGQEISKFWVAAVAYDQNGQVIGIRRYERTEALKFGEELLFSLNVYSVGGKIDRIELFGEGIP